MSRLYFAPLEEAFYLRSDNIKDTKTEIDNLKKLIMDSTISKKPQNNQISKIQENPNKVDQRIGYSDQINAKFKKDDPDLFNTDGIEVRLIYMRLFNEYLNFPFNSLLKLRKTAGFDDGNIKGKELFDKICYEILEENDLDPTDYLNPPIDFPDIYDRSGGYPFGQDKPSYREAIEKFLDPDTPINGTEIQDAFDFGSYCTPIISVTPGTQFDSSIFNVPGQEELSDKSTCPATSIGVMSCLKAGISPGVVDSSLSNSRIAFCIDKKNQTKDLTEI